jgi:hypothetical protein
MVQAPAQTPTEAGAASNDVIPYRYQLQQLQKLLDSQQGTQGSLSPPSTADAHLAALRHAAAALRQQQQQQQQQQQLRKLQIERVEESPEEMQACLAAVGCLGVLAQQLLQPPTDLYCGLSGAPCDPPEGLELAGRSSRSSCHCDNRAAVLHPSVW